MEDAVRDWIGVMNSEKKYRDKKASEEFNCPAYQARKLIRIQGDYLQEDPNE